MQLVSVSHGKVCMTCHGWCAWVLCGVWCVLYVCVSG